MKKLSKLLCAVLVLAMICSSLIFVVGAEEEVPAYTSVPNANSGDIIAAIKYDAEGNLLKGASLITAAANGAWNTEGAPQSHIVTNNKTGESYLHQFMNGQFLLSDTTDNGNEYINFTFDSVNLQYEAGFHEYVIVEYDIAYSSVPGTFTVPKTGATKSSDVLKQEVIVRGSSAGTSWSSVQQFGKMLLQPGFNHVTTVYDYTSGTSYTFVNGDLTLTLENGALSKGVLPTYLEGQKLNTSEWRVGSNSYDDMHLDNVYIRYTKAADAEDTLDDAIASGKLNAWSGNIYNSEYKVTTPHWFVQTFPGVSDFKDNNVTGAGYAVSTVADNRITFVSAGNPSDLPCISMGYVDGADSYLMAYANQYYSGKLSSGHNRFFAVNTANSDPFTVVGADAKGYYVIDFDIATHGNMFPGFDVSVVMRRNSDKGGFPFSDEIYVDGFVTENNAWSHVTIIGDIANNEALVFVNGQLQGSAGLAVRTSNDAGKLANDTQVVAQGYRVELCRNNIQTNLNIGDNVAFDNFAHRLFIENGADLTAALADGDITDWTAYTGGRGGEALPQLATVNGVSYNNAAELTAALTSNKQLEVEFTGMPVAPVTVTANAVINTNGLDRAKLFTLGKGCEIVSEADGIVTTTSPFVSNMNVVDIATGNVEALVKAHNSDNQLGAPMFVYYDGGQEGVRPAGSERRVSLVTDLLTGQKYVKDYGYGDVIGTLGNSNVYVDWHTTNDKAIMTYELGVNQFIVFDIDFAIEQYATNNTKINLNVITRNSGGGGVWGNNAVFFDDIFANAGIPLGEFAHVTAVVSPDTREMHIFVNGQYLYFIKNAISDVQSGYYCNGIRTFSSSDAVAGYTNVSFRCVKDAELAQAIAANDISLWSKNLFTEDYELPSAPIIATVDGVAHSTIASLNKALATETEGVKEVEFTRPISDTIEIRTEANVETYGLDLNFDYKTGHYEFKHSTAYYQEVVPSEYVTASNRLVLDHKDGSTVYSFLEITEENCDRYATRVDWYSHLDEDYNKDVFDVVYYVYGDQIAPVGEDSYIEDGKLVTKQWKLLDQDYNIGDVVASFPVANSTLDPMKVLGEGAKIDVDFAAPVKQNANVSSNIQFNVYVPADKTLTSGEITVIGGVEYVTFTFEFAPADFAKSHVVEFEVQDAEGNVYIQKQNVSFLGYAESLLASDEQNAELKALVAGLVDYSNKAHKLFNGETVADADALLTTYAANVPTATPSEVKNTTDLAAVIRSAAMRLNETPEFIFKVARGFKGTLEFTYTGVNGEVKVTETVDATDCEQIVVLDSFDVSDIFEDIAVVATAENGTVVTGEYNLSTYAAGLADAEFANALIAYAQAAKEYKTKYSVYLAGKLNVTDLDAAAVESATLKTIVAGKIKQCDQSNPGTDPAVDPFAEGGTPRYVLANKADGSQVEALYFSRSVAWTGTEKAHFTEFRFAVNGEQAGAVVTKITFEYLVNGSVKENTRHEFTDLDGTKFHADAYVQIKTPTNHPGAGDNYPELQNTDLIFDGQWHTMVVDLGEGVEIIDILLNLYQFQGEMLIANLELTYA